MTGRNTANIQLASEQLPNNPAILSGNFDAKGGRIDAHLLSLRSDVFWASPPLGQPPVALSRQREEWTPDLDRQRGPALFQRLATAGMWLTQEALVLDPWHTGYPEGMVGS